MNRPPLESWLEELATDVSAWPKRDYEGAIEWASRYALALEARLAALEAKIEATALEVARECFSIETSRCVCNMTLTLPEFERKARAVLERRKEGRG